MPRRFSPTFERDRPEQPRAQSAFEVTFDQQLLDLITEFPDWLRVKCGRKPSRATGIRWASRGPCGAPPLPTIKIGARRYTSVEALEWWCQQLSARPGSPAVPRIRVRQIEAAADRLKLTLGSKPGSNERGRSR